MSKYTEISKRIGWDNGTKVGIPSLNEARQWQTAVMVNKDADAFEKVFKVKRFAPSPDGGEDGAAMELIWQTFNDGSKFFQ